MAYVRKLKLIHLDFDENHELHGLHVDFTPLNVGEMLDLSGIKKLSKVDTTDLSEEQQSEIGAIFEQVAEHLVGWDMCDENPVKGGPPIPVPATVEGLRSLDLPAFVAIVTGWMEAQAAVKPDLGKGSSSGPPSPALAIPMAPLSPSPPS